MGEEQRKAEHIFSRTAAGSNGAERTTINKARTMKNTTGHETGTTKNLDGRTTIMAADGHDTNMEDTAEEGMIEVTVGCKQLYTDDNKDGLNRNGYQQTDIR